MWFNPATSSATGCWPSWLRPPSRKAAGRLCSTTRSSRRSPARTGTRKVHHRRARCSWSWFPPQSTPSQPVSTWYAAHILMYVKLKEGTLKGIPVWENIVLIEAQSDEEAFAKAKKKGEESAGDDGGSFRWAGKPATWVVAGVRKVTLCEDAEERPGDGTEITYVQLRVSLLCGCPSFATLGSVAARDGSRTRRLSLA